MSNLNTGPFTLRGGGVEIYANLLCLTHIFFIFLNRETHFGRCPMLLSPSSNNKHNVDQPCTHDIPSSTKHNVNLYYALTPMSCDVLVHNALQSCHCSFIPCYIYDKCYMCMPTHASLPMHHLDLDIYSKKHTNSKYVIQFMPSYQYTHTLTSQITTTRVATSINL